MYQFLMAEDVQAIHDDILATEPGREGIYEDRLEAVIGRVQNAYTYSGEINNVFTLAAYYAEALAVGHAFVDGNKRTAFTTCMTVLEVNGVVLSDELKNSHDSWTELMVMLAEKTLSYPELAERIALAQLLTIGFEVAKVAEWLTE